jgi:hypothetical protein
MIYWLEMKVEKNNTKKTLLYETKNVVARELGLLFDTKKLSLKNALILAFLIIIALLPVHAVFSTWAISNFGHQDIFKSWKEILLFAVAFPLALGAAYRKPEIIRELLAKKINKLAMLFIGLNAIMLLVSHYGLRSEAAGFAFNTRFLVYFLYAQIVASYVDKESLRRVASWLIYLGGGLIVLFGFLQVVLLPKDLLAHLGYSKFTILPYYTVSQNTYFVRIISTLRGPNELGAYMVFWFPFLIVASLKFWNRNLNYKYLTVFAWVASVTTLYGSGSRSAIIASFASIVVTIFLVVNRNIKKEMIIAGLIIGVLGSLLLIAGRNTRFEQVTVFHKDPTVKVVTNSNAQHLQSVREAVKIIKQHPLGLGVGTTNIASTYGPKSLTVENYFLQMMVETGVVGGILFLSTCGFLAIELLKRHADRLATALFAGLIGITIVAMLLPVWGDETLSMLFWGLAGIVISKRTILKPTKNATV